MFDREGDVFEAMEQLLALDHGFVIRAVRDRKCKVPTGLPSHSFNAVESAPELGRVPFTVPRRPGQDPRQVTLSIRSAETQLSTPKSVGRMGTPLPVRMVLVREDDPPKGVEPVVWYLLDEEEAPPEVLDDTQKAILRSRFPRLPSAPTAREWLRAVAMLGGFMGRKSQEPGWRTLWWGWQRLELLAEGWKLAAARGARTTAEG